VTHEHRRRIALAIMALGVALRAWQFIGRGTLWLDEAAIARNVVARGYRALLEPLDFAQIAPKGFLLVEKLAVELFGPTELALRLFPFLTALAALPFFYRLARRVLTERGALMALGLFAVLSRPIHYGAEAKQYGSDIFFAIVLLLFALPVIRGKPGARHALRLAAVGAIAVWFSQPAIFILAGVAAAVALAVVQRRIRVGWPFGVMVAVWAVSALPAVWMTMRSLRGLENDYMRSFWAEGFWPAPTGLTGLAWPILTLYGLFEDPLGMPVPAIGIALFALGWFVIARGGATELVLLLSPFAFALGASALRLFPFATTIIGFNKIAAGNGRVLLFLLPALILVTIAGLHYLVWAPTRLARHVGRGLAVLVLGAPLYYDIVELPHTPHDLREVMRVVVRERQPGDRLYVYYGARQAFEFYRASFPFADEEVTLGGCMRPHWREYLRQVDELRGRSRLWVLIAHPSTMRGVREGAVLEGYLDRIAPKLGRWGQRDATLLLYDMRAASRPAAADPALWHPPPRRLPADTVPLGHSCMGVFPPFSAR
jgi:hypothetical protein